MSIISNTVDCMIVGIHNIAAKKENHIKVFFKQHFDNEVSPFREDTEYSNKKATMTVKVDDELELQNQSFHKMKNMKLRK